MLMCMAEVSVENGWELKMMVELALWGVKHIQILYNLRGITGLLRVSILVPRRRAGKW